MNGGRWTAELASAARADFIDIMAWTEQHFGARQARAYAAAITAAVRALNDGPMVAGSKDWSVVGPGIRSLSMPRPGRHVLVYRVPDREPRTIEVIRILHDAMDLPRHMLPA